MNKALATNKGVCVKQELMTENAHLHAKRACLLMKTQRDRHDVFLMRSYRRIKEKFFSNSNKSCRSP